MPLSVKENVYYEAIGSADMQTDIDNCHYEGDQRNDFSYSCYIAKLLKAQDPHNRRNGDAYMTDAYNMYSVSDKDSPGCAVGIYPER
jgi:hypothetical protein